MSDGIGYRTLSLCICSEGVLTQVAHLFFWLLGRSELCEAKSRSPRTATRWYKLVSVVLHSSSISDNLIYVSWLRNAQVSEFSLAWFFCRHLYLRVCNRKNFSYAWPWQVIGQVWFCTFLCIFVHHELYRVTVPSRKATYDPLPRSVDV